jgi:hypothetical protein
VNSGEADYLLKRLALSLSSTGDGVETFDNLTRRSFGFFLQNRANKEAAQLWLDERRQQLQSLIVEATDDSLGRNWIQELAAKSGSSPKFITTLSDAFSHAPVTSSDAGDWLPWLLRQLPVDDNDFDNFIRPDDVERVFGRGYTSAATEVLRRERAREAILCVLPDWFSASPLDVLETRIVDFIKAKEGNVKRPTSEDSKAKRGRRFALRLVSDLSYLAGVLAQVSAKISAADSQEPLAITQSLPLLVRRGFNSPYHLYFDRDEPGRSRQAIETQFKAIAPKIQREPTDTWDRIREKVLVTAFDSIFTSDTFTKLLQNRTLIESPPKQLPKPPDDDEVG